MATATFTAGVRVGVVSQGIIKGPYIIEQIVNNACGDSVASLILELFGTNLHNSQLEAVLALQVMEPELSEVPLHFLVTIPDLYQRVHTLQRLKSDYLGQPDCRLKVQQCLLIPTSINIPWSGPVPPKDMSEWYGKHKRKRDTPIFLETEKHPKLESETDSSAQQSSR